MSHPQLLTSLPLPGTLGKMLSPVHLWGTEQESDHVAFRGKIRFESFTNKLRAFFDMSLFIKTKTF